MFQELKEDIIAQIGVVINAPIPFFVAIILVGIGIRKFVDSAHAREIAAKNGTIEQKDATIAYLKQLQESESTKAEAATGGPISQEAIDQLAELRSEGIHSILNAPVQNQDEWEMLCAVKVEWWDRVKRHLEANFTKADELQFTRLGTVPLLTFPHVFNEGHAKILREFAVQEQRLMDIVKNAQIR